MISRIAAAFALTPASSLQAQAVATPPSVDYSTASPIDGNWLFATVPGGSQATFVNASAQPQLTLTCARAARQVTIAKPAGSAAALLAVWTSTQSRNLPASFNPATARISAVVSAYDPLLDAIAFSRGRVAVSVAGQPALVVPAWADTARVIEDCRA